MTASTAQNSALTVSVACAIVEAAIASARSAGDGAPLYVNGTLAAWRFLRERAPANFHDYAASLPRGDRFELERALRGTTAADPGEAAGALLRPLDAFLATLKPVEWLVDGLLARGDVTVNTGPTNHGKTAVGLSIMVLSSAGRPLLRHRCRPVRWAVLCGENPSGFGARLVATCQALEVPLERVLPAVQILDRALPLGAATDKLCVELDAFGADAVLIETSAAYFGGDDENNNVQAREHAAAMRRLTLGKSKARTVLASTHPVGNATRDNLVPRGGSAFLNEIDNNLTTWNDGGTLTLHWHRKLRQADFNPIAFELVTQSVTVAGIEVSTVAAVPINDQRAAEQERARTEDENRVLYELLHHPHASLADWARGAGMLFTTGEPAKSRVQRVLGRLQDDRLVRRYRGRWVLTADGKDEAKGIK